MFHSSLSREAPFLAKPLKLMLCFDNRTQQKNESVQHILHYHLLCKFLHRHYYVPKICNCLSFLCLIHYKASAKISHSQVIRLSKYLVVGLFL